MSAIKRSLTLLLFISFHPLMAQIELNGRPIVHNVECKHSVMGSIEVHIKPQHPPYIFNWSNGAHTEKIDELETGNYSLVIKDANNSDTTLHFVITEDLCTMAPQIFFTPNGDGINDEWDIAYAQFFTNSFVAVYNRLGQPVFQQTGEYGVTHGWDGTDALGVPLPVSTYYYVIYPDRSNKNNVVKGSVSIIR